MLATCSLSTSFTSRTLLLVLLVSGNDAASASCHHSSDALPESNILIALGENMAEPILLCFVARVVEVRDAEVTLASVHLCRQGK